jgi:hypothetical protein
VKGLLLVTHVAAYATLLLTTMSPGKALAFAALHQALFGMHLGMAFAPNHKGREMPDPDGERPCHLRRQVLTSPNIRGGVLTDWFLGGLNHQIEPGVGYPLCGDRARRLLPTGPGPPPRGGRAPQGAVTETPLRDESGSRLRDVSGSWVGTVGNAGPFSGQRAAVAAKEATQCRRTRRSRQAVWRSGSSC